MTTAQDAGNKLTSLLSTLAERHTVEEPPARDPVTQLIVSFLTWNATRKKAEQAFERIMRELTDNNDIRVTYTQELVALIGEDYPDAWERCARLHEALHEVYLREYDVKMTTMEGKSKKEQRHYLDTLPGITPYVAAQVTLLCFGGHAMPLDDKLLELLVAEDVFKPDTTPAQAEGVLLKHIKAADAYQNHLLLQAWADRSRVSRKSTSGSGAASKPTGGSKTTTKKKSTKKKTTPKTAAKASKS